MAITRAQQAKQMLQNGGMLVQPGFGGTRQGYRGDDAYGGGRDPSGPSGGTGEDNRQAYSAQATQLGPKSRRDEKDREQRIEDIEKFINRPKFGFTDAAKTNLLSPKSLAKTLIGFPGLNFLQNIKVKETTPPTTKSDEDGEGQLIPVDTTFADAPVTSAPVAPSTGENLTRIAYRLMADGGAVIDDEPRQAYGLGSIVKKATRAVKKVAKSDIGKAAIAAAGIYYLGGGKMFGGEGFKFTNLPGAGFLSGSAGTTAAKGNLGIAGYNMANVAGPKTGLGLTGKAMLGIGALSALPLLGVGVEEDEEEPVTNAYLGDSLDIAAIRANPRAFQGQAYRLMAEGGDTEDAKEPVAKKVMPLIDMDGQEKDYRETGGFVDMGRMEKADDVPARLSKNEFVFTADAVRNAGDGSVDKGAEVMYNMMKNLEAGGEVSEESQGLEGARKMFQTSQRLEEVL